MIFIIISILIVLGLFIVRLRLGREENVMKAKFRLARNSKANRLLIEDKKRNSKNHPLN